MSCLEWGPPYTKGVNKLKILCIRTYLSRGNVGGPLDTWIETKDGDDPGNKEALRTVLRGDGANFDDTVTISISNVSRIGVLGNQDRVGITCSPKVRSLQYRIPTNMRSFDKYK